MTIANTASSVTVLGNGAATSFNYDFEIPIGAGWTLTFTDATGTQTLLPSSVYSISGIGNEQGGSFQYPLSGSPIANGTSLTLVRAVPNTQPTSFTSQSNYSPNLAENAMDWIVMQIQQIAAGLGRTLQIPPVDPVDTLTTLPAAAQRAGDFLAFDSQGNVMATPGPAGGALVSSAMVPVVEAATRSIALQLLGVSAAMAPVVAAVSTSAAAVLLGISAAMAPVVSAASPSAALHLLPYSLGATGAATRAVDVKLKDIVSALDFTGVDPTGAADSTAGFQALINYLQSIGGGAGIIPAGTYKIAGTLNITASNVALIGTSEYGTVLSFANGAADGIRVGFQGASVKGVTLRNMSLVGASKTGGSLINANNYANSTFSDLSLRNAFNGISMSTLNNCTLSNIEITHSVSGGLGGVIWTSPANNTQRSDVLTLRDVVVNANGTGATGLYIDGMCQTLRVDNCGMIHCKYGLWVRNTAASNQFYPQFFYVNDLEIDGVDVSSVQIEGGREMHFTHLDCFNAGGAGADIWVMSILADGVASVTNDLTFTACRFAGGRQGGVYCEAKQVEFVGCYIGDNSVQGSNAFPGIALGNNGLTNGAAVGVNYIGGRIGSVFGDLGNQSWGMTVAAGCSRVNAVGVDFSTCVTGAIQDNTGGFGNVTWSTCYGIAGAPMANRLPQLAADPSGAALYEGLIWENVTSFALKVRLNGVTKTVTVS